MRERQRDRENERETERQRDRETESERARERESERARERENDCLALAQCALVERHAASSPARATADLPVNKT